MSIHSEIKRLRLLKGWSLRQLAEEVSKIEGANRPLNWQTVQQWEREPTAGGAGKSTAPKRERLQAVATALGTTPAALMSGEPAAPSAMSGLDGVEGMLIAYFRMLKPGDRDVLLHQAQERAASYLVAPEKPDGTRG